MSRSIGGYREPSQLAFRIVRALLKDGNLTNPYFTRQDAEVVDRVLREDKKGDSNSEDQQSFGARQTAFGHDGGGADRTERL